MVVLRGNYGRSRRIEVPCPTGMLSHRRTGCGSGEAADTTGELHGVVVDSEGIGLSGVRVALSSEVLIGGVHEKTTGDDGRFNFRTLPPGSYLIRAELEGLGRSRLRRWCSSTAAPISASRWPRLAFRTRSPSRWPPQPVQMDITRVHVGETYNQEFLEVAAIGIDGRSVLGIIGKEAGVEGGARPRIMGSTYSENVFLIDGLNTTDPVLGTAYLEINFDALQEIAVHTGGFEAEYGHALGGVINAVTKSGGNSVTGTVDLRYRDPNLAESGEYFDPDRDPTSQLSVRRPSAVPSSATACGTSQAFSAAPSKPPGISPRSPRNGDSPTCWAS